MVLGSGTSLGWSVRRGGGLLNACFFFCLGASRVLLIALS